MSIEFLSAVSDIPKPALLALENAEIFPSWELVTKLSSAFGCSYMRILFAEDEVNEAISF